MNGWFLGLDCSTQSLSAIIVDDADKRVIYETSVHFDNELPHYHTLHGCLQNDDPLIKHSDPLMWVEALDLLFKKMKAEGVDLQRILAISGSAQQHGSVYLNAKGLSRFAALDPKKSLKQNMQDGLSRKTSPIWMDSSTSKECEEIEGAFGGADKLREATGSHAFERFTASQIRKFFKEDNSAFLQTAQITLISAFMASLLSGTLAPIDYCDGAGMNLMDIENKTWHQTALQATAHDLNKRLPSLAAPWKIIGRVSPYFVHKYGLNPNALAMVWSGDNPNSLIGLGVIKDRVAAISLGTSFTYFGHMAKYCSDASGEGHVFAAPTGWYMSLICFKNGALAIEKLCEMYSLDRKGFDATLLKTKPGNSGRILLPYFEAEIVPRVRKGVCRFDLDNDDVAGNCRGLVEGQIMSMKLHSEWMKTKPEMLYATGGVSVNPHVLQIIADVFNCPVKQIAVSKSAALGAAFRAVHGYFMQNGVDVEWEKIISPFIADLTQTEMTPDPVATKVYDTLLEKYALYETVIKENESLLTASMY